MRKFDSLAEVDSLTDDESLEIISMAWDTLKAVADGSPYGLDDQGDYLTAAVDNYSMLVSLYIGNDGDPTALHEGIVKWLHDPNWGGCDGEVRFDLFTDRFQEEVWEWNDATHRYWEATHPKEMKQIATSDYPIRHSKTPAAKQWNHDMATIEGKFHTEWPDDVRKRVEKFRR